MTLRTIGLMTLISAASASAGPRAVAQLAPLQQSTPPTAGDRLASQSAEAELAGDHDKALRLADEASKADPKNPWAYYDRGDALAALRRPDEAIAAFHEAEQRYSEAEVWGKSIAIWGQANVLSRASRCQEAAPIFERYASLVERVDKGAAELARQHAKQCTSRPVAH
jgi:tetratricopeptide (TPR) repeat protein